MRKKTGEKICYLAELGYSPERIAKRTGASSSTVNNLLVREDKHNRLVSLSAVIHKVLGKEILEVMEAGGGLNNISRVLKVSRYTVGNSVPPALKGKIGRPEGTLMLRRAKALYSLDIRSRLFGEPGSEEWEYRMRETAYTGIYPTTPPTDGNKVQAAPDPKVEELRKILPDNMSLEITAEPEAASEDDDYDDEEEYTHRTCGLETRLTYPVMRQATVAFLYTHKMMTIRQIGSLIGYSHETVRSDLIRSGVPLRPRFNK